MFVPKLPDSRVVVVTTLVVGNAAKALLLLLLLAFLLHFASLAMVLLFTSVADFTIAYHINYRFVYKLEDMIHKIASYINLRSSCVCVLAISSSYDTKFNANLPNENMYHLVPEI